MKGLVTEILNLSYKGSVVRELEEHGFTRYMVSMEDGLLVKHYAFPRQYRCKECDSEGRRDHPVQIHAFDNYHRAICSTHGCLCEDCKGLDA